MLQRHNDDDVCVLQRHNDGDVCVLQRHNDGDVMFVCCSDITMVM